MTEPLGIMQPHKAESCCSTSTAEWGGIQSCRSGCFVQESLGASGQERDCRDAASGWWHRCQCQLRFEKPRVSLPRVAAMCKVLRRTVAWMDI